METFENIPLTHQTWNKSYMLDISMIDNQHVKFFMLFDKMLELNKSDNSHAQILDVLEELEKYTHVHFATEEALMRKAQTHDYELHVVQHKVFIDKIEEFKIAYNYNNAALLEQMITFMRKWFLMHISEIDRKYVDPVKKYLNERGTINIE
jgi:hemerythrin